MAHELDATVRESGSLLVIDLQGEVTTFAEASITTAFRAASARGARDVLLCFAEVEYLNSAGIAVLIGLLTEARQAQQRLLMTGLTPHYQKIFQMMGLAQYVPIMATEDAARRYVEGDGSQP